MRRGKRRRSRRRGAGVGGEEEGIVPSALDPFVLANFTPYKCFHLLLFGPIYTDFLQAAPVVLFILPPFTLIQNKRYIPILCKHFSKLDGGKFMHARHVVFSLHFEMLIH